LSSQNRKKGILGGVAAVLLAAAAYLIFFRGDESAPAVTAAEAQADAVSKAMEKAGASTAAAPDFEHPKTKGAMNKQGTR
jgi:hypothetical protein